MQLRVLLASALCAALALPVLAHAGGVAAPAALPGCDDHVLAAGLVPAYDVSAAPCPGIRPGGALIIPAGPLEIVYCTMAFIVTDGTDLYVATAGHCVEDSLGVPSVGERVWAHGVGEFGTVAYQWCEGEATNGGCGIGADFGLIRIDADKHAFVDPAMCGWGAPTGGLFTGDYVLAEGDAPLLVKHFGWGMGVAAVDVGVNLLGVHAQPANPVTQPREGLLLEADEAALDFDSPGDGFANAAYLQTAAFSGDSGSGVLVVAPPDLVSLAEPAPQALGVLTHISNVGTFAQRLDVSLAKAGAEMGKTFTLVPS